MAKQVTIYSTPTCTYCRAAKEFFAEHNVQYTEHNVATDTERRNEMIEKSGQMGVPVIMIDNEIVIGYNKSKLTSLLGL
ncbi:MAG: glutaredoxin domain-containing protein [Patescibacteria group bacterium]